MTPAIAILLLTVFSQSALAEPVRKVRIDFVEALAPRDTTSSVRFQKEYEDTIALGKNFLKSKLAGCGYELDTKTAFYEAGDALKAKEIATKLNTEGSWLIVGPRRSNHYLLLAQGAGQTPTISPMASADDVSKLGADHTSLSPSNSEMAQIAAKEVKTRIGKHATYMGVISDDCTACVDFAKAFDRSAAEFGLKKIGEIQVHGETFEIDPIRAAILENNPSVVLLPDYSKVAARVMGAFNNTAHSPLFVGGDGWGDQRYGFVQPEANIEAVSGITVRGFPPVDQGLKTFSLGKQVSAGAQKLPFTGASLGILKILDDTANRLCSGRPLNREDFAALTRKTKLNRIHAPWGVSIYQLSAGQILFNKTVGVQ